jgi:hypothetical protein
MRLKQQLLFALTNLIFTTAAFAQPAQGYFTSEAKTLYSNDNIIVSIKKYNPTEDEIKKIITPEKNAPMTYLQVPFTVTNANLFDNGFESNLYCLDRSGNVKWSKILGFSKNSTASPVAVDKDFLYAGEGVKEAGKVQLQKIDKNGTAIWSKTFDSLENVNDILIAGNIVNALVSFEVSKKVVHADKTFSYNTYPIYFFLQLDIETGAVIKKEYQMMGNYLSSLGFTNPHISSYQSYYLNKKDSAMYLSTLNQQSATTVSENLPKRISILNLIAGPSENHYLTLSKDKDYVLFTNFYGKEKKYTSNLPVNINNNAFNRTALLQTEKDSMISIINSGTDINVCYTDTTGKSDCSIKKNILKSLMVGTGLIGNKPYFITVTGRDKPGMPGKIELVYY